MRRPILVAAAVLAGVAAVTGCTQPAPPPTALGAATSSSRPTVTGSVPAGGACVAEGPGPDWRPDRSCTPGVVDPSVALDGPPTVPGLYVHTICKAGWATARRKALFPLTVSEPLKARLVAAYGAYAGKSLRRYELDHLVPVSLGGAVANVGNLWPEAPPTPNRKDGVEAALRTAVCSERITLGDAQRDIAAAWTAVAVERAIKGTSVDPDDR